MALKEQILLSMKEALKSKETARLSTLRFLQAAIKNKEIELRPKAITDEDILGVLRKQQKQRQESIQQFEKANRPDLIEKEENEARIIAEFLPQPLSESELESIVLRAIQETGATTEKEFGQVMKAAIRMSDGRADGKSLNTKIREKLNT